MCKEFYQTQVCILKPTLKEFHIDFRHIISFEDQLSVTKTVNLDENLKTRTGGKGKARG